MTQSFSSVRLPQFLQRGQGSWLHGATVNPQMFPLPTASDLISLVRVPPPQGLEHSDQSVTSQSLSQGDRVGMQERSYSIFSFVRSGHTFPFNSDATLTNRVWTPSPHVAEQSDHDDNLQSTSTGGGGVGLPPQLVSIHVHTLTAFGMIGCEQKSRWTWAQ